MSWLWLAYRTIQNRNDVLIVTAGARNYNIPFLPMATDLLWLNDLYLTYPDLPAIDNTAVSDCTIALQAAIDKVIAVYAHPRPMFLKGGDYAVSAPIILPYWARLYGEGAQATTIVPRFISPGSVIQIGTTGVGISAYAGLHGIGFTKFSAVPVTLIECVDVSNVEISDIICYPIIPGSDTMTVGIKTRGREFIHLRNLQLSCPIPVNISTNPNSSISIDHLRARDLYLLPTATNSSILVDDGVSVTHSHFWDVAMVGGANGFVWNSPTHTQISSQFNFNRVHYEQGTNTAGYAFRFNMSAASNLQSLIMNDCNLGSGNNGIYLRNVYTAGLDNIKYDDTRVFIDTDDCDNIRWQNSFIQTGATKSMVGLTQRHVLGLPGGGATVANTEFWTI